MISSIADALSRYNSFQECVLLDYWSTNLCRDLHVLVDNIWKGPDRMRTDLDEHDFVELRFHSCRRLHINNWLPDSVLQSPQMANWSLSEFALIKVDRAGDGLYTVQILWETERRIELECEGVDVVSVPSTPELVARYAWPNLS